MTATVGNVEWTHLELQQRLGEGASGVISRALWRRDDRARPEPVAVKLFKADMTSDGLPSSEIAACLTVGDHPNLVGACGVVAGHPDGAAGMVMRLVDPEFVNLAGPPSLESCSRDVYASDATFTLSQVEAIAGGVANAARQMHDRGVLHGDLYGHNTLVAPSGAALLGDFGAASFLPHDAAESTALQRIEARAFGVLLDELLDRCPPGDTERLRELARRCTADAAARPSFEAIGLSLRRPA